MESHRQQYFEILNDSIDILVKSSNSRLWTQLHTVFDLSIKTFIQIAHETNFKFESQEHREYVLLNLTFLITNHILYGNNKQKRLKGGVKIHLQSGRVQAPRTHKVHRQQNRPHAKTFKQQNREFFADEWKKTKAERKLAEDFEFMIKHPINTINADVIAMADTGNPNKALLVVKVLLMLLKPIEFFQNLPAEQWKLPPTDKLNVDGIEENRVAVIEVATQLSDPRAAAAELLSALPMEVYKGPSTAFIDNRRCPVVKQVPLDGRLTFSKEDLHTLQVVDILTLTNYSHGEFGCLMNYNATGQLTISPVLIKGERGETYLPPRNDVENKTVALCHLHPHDTDRVFSPPSAADFIGYVGNLVVFDIPYSVVFTSRGHYYISLQENIATVIHKIYLRSQKLAREEDRAQALGSLGDIMELFIEPRTIEKITSEISVLLEDCSETPSGLLSIGQNIVKVNLDVKNYGRVKMISGFDIHFVNNEDLRQGKMIQLPLIKKFSKEPSVGLSGTQLSSELARIFELAGDELNLLTNKTHASQDLFLNAWTQLSQTEQEEYMVVMHHLFYEKQKDLAYAKVEEEFAARNMVVDPANPLYKNLFSKAFISESVRKQAHEEVVVPEVLSRISQIIRNEKAASQAIPASKPTFFSWLSGAFRGGSQKRKKHSILDRPGIITKMIFGEHVKETMFMHLPYPLDLLKEYI